MSELLKANGRSLRQALALMFLFASFGSAYAYSPDVKAKCRGDYFAHCSYLDPYSRGVQDCMYFNRHKLSMHCKVALIKDGWLKKFKKAPR